MAGKISADGGWRVKFTLYKVRLTWFFNQETICLTFQMCLEKLTDKYPLQAEVRAAIEAAAIRLPESQAKLV
jgi:hypothetical protein